MPDDSDRALLHRMAGGDADALAALYDQRGERVYTVAYWVLGDADEAEDVVEETFWQAWRTAGRYDAGRAAGLTWLLMIARSRALDRLRALRRRADWAVAPATTSALLDQMSEPVQEDPVEQRKRHSQVAAAVRELPPEQREALELAFFGGLSHSEIAVRISKPLGTVKTRIRLAMQKLRQQLASLGEDGI